jgi:hypothetical protein
VADKMTLKDKGGSFEPHQAGQFAARCVDLIDLGQRIETFPGSAPKIVDKMVLVYVTDSETDPKDIAREFSASFNEKSAVRKWLEDWRGKTYTREQAAEGIPVEKLIGVPCLVSVEHKVSGKGRTYAHLKSISPLPKKMEAPDGKDYVRAPYWAERIATYKTECATWASAQERTDYPDQAPEDDSTGGDELPFD